MTYFRNVHTVGDVKSLYRKLAKQYHPDLHGPETTAVMQAVNDEYHDLLARLDGQTSIGSDGKEHTYRYDRDVEQAVMDKIAELLALNLAGVEIELIGTWVWVSGDTKPVKEQLKTAGCHWHGKRQRWYWHGKTYRRRYSAMDFNTLRQMYGSQRFEVADEKTVATA